jgi:uncharacterized OB-fold protein
MASENESTVGHNGADWSETPKYLWPRPNLVDREFWEGARRGELRLQHCTTCGRHQHYPRMLCSHCGAATLEWITASGDGTIYSYTVVRQNGVPPFSERVPFVVATIDLDEEGARMLASMPTLAPDAARIGMRVRARFRAATEEFGFVDFATAEG